MQIAKCSQEIYSDGQNVGQTDRIVAEELQHCQFIPIIELTGCLL